MTISLSMLNSGNKQFQWRIVTGIVLSVLIHLIVLFGIVRQPDPKPMSSDAIKSPIEVTLMAPPKPSVATPPVPPQPAVKPPVKPSVTQKAVPAPRKPVPVKSTAKPAPLKLPSDISLPKQSETAQDMSQMLNQARERRQEEAAASAPPSPPSANEIAKANIDFQMNRSKDGKNGIFDIISKGPRVAVYAFYGWDKNRRDARKQIITVDAGANGDVEMAIVNSMISIIRQYYKGNFNWQSDRLGKVIILSARQEDTKELQTFLKQEMFSR